MSEANARDAGTERLLRSALRPPPEGGADACPDAGMLAAFVEGGLTAAEEAALDAHIAACGRCQETLAALAPSLPEDAAADAAEDPVASRRSWWFTWATRPRLRWLVPISATATVAVVLFATRPLIAPDAIRPAIELTRADEAARGAAASLEPSKTAMNARADAASPADAERDARVPEPPTQLLAARIAPEEKAASKERPAATPPAPAPPAAPPARSYPAEPIAAAKRDELLAQLRDRESMATVTAASDRTVRWELGPVGRIWRSVDSGETWRQQRSGVSSDLIAGSAPSATTCWVVGVAGTVLLTTDGERWERRPFPLAVDLTAVEASSSREATITTRDGQRFETLDGGQTWSPKRGQALSR